MFYPGGVYDSAPDRPRREFQAQRAEEARKTTLARAEHVWVRQDYFSGSEWRHGLLLGWIRWRDGELLGRVLVAMMSWNQWTEEWGTSWWEQLVDPDKIRLARSVPIGREEGE